LEWHARHMLTCRGDHLRKTGNGTHLQQGLGRQRRRRIQPRTPVAVFLVHVLVTIRRGVVIPPNRPSSTAGRSRARDRAESEGSCHCSCGQRRRGAQVCCKKREETRRGRSGALRKGRERDGRGRTDCCFSCEGGLVGALLPGRKRTCDGYVSSDLGRVCGGGVPVQKAEGSRELGVVSGGIFEAVVSVVVCCRCVVCMWNAVECG
jgi:hypothetical protein